MAHMVRRLPDGIGGRPSGNRRAGTPFPSSPRIRFIEKNDGFALGSYGLGDVTYALLLSARWAELVGAEDPLRGRPVPGMA